MIRDNDYSALGQLQHFARYKTHPGYVWAAICADGELLCETCVRGNYRQVFRATRDANHRDWQCIGLTNSGESETTEHCAHCNKLLWEEVQS